MTKEGSVIVIEQQCALIQEPNKSLTNDELKTSLDSIVGELNNDKLLNNATTIQQIVKTISLRSKNDQIFSRENLFDHQLFFIVRDYYLDLLCRWRNGQNFDEHSAELFSQIAVLFADLCCNATDTNVNSLKTLLIHEPLINEICACLKDIAINGKHLQNKQVKVIDYNIRAIHYLEKGRPEIQNISIVTALFNNIIHCVCSSYFIDMFKQIRVIRVECPHKKEHEH